MKLFIEIGVENFPAVSLEHTLKELKNNFMEHFAFRCDVDVKGTYRRLIIDVNNLQFIGEVEKKILGPPYNLCFNDNKLNNVGIKFLEKNEAKEQDIFIHEEKGKKYLGIIKKERVNLEDSVNNALNKAISNLSFIVKMIWSNINFLRPIRYLTAFVDNKMLNLKLGDIESSNFIKIGMKKIIIESYDDYFNKITNLKISEEERDKNISKDVSRTTVFYEAINNTENPKAILCTFDEKFSELPYEIIKKTIEIHQFGIMNSNNSYFVICEKDNNDDYVRKGNEQVVSSRLDDAAMFVKEDNDKTIERFSNELNNISFQEGLGSMKDKQDRLTKLSKIYKEKFSLKSTIVDTAKICKFDLSTSVVKEKDYAELKGQIGKSYALTRGVDKNVSLNLFEHYLPRFNGDELPQSREAAILSVLDKVDNIVGFAVLNKLPTGAKDPFYLRRDAISVLEVIEAFDLDINFNEIFKDVIEVYNKKVNINDLNDFMKNRIESYLNNKFDKSIVNSVIDYWNNFKDITKRASSLSKMNFTSIKDSFMRVDNLLKKADKEFVVNKDLANKKEEKDLIEKIELIDKLENYDEILNNIEKLNLELSNFFDRIVVMSDVKEEKNNRLAILQYLRKVMNKVGSIDKILKG